MATPNLSLPVKLTGQDGYSIPDLGDNGPSNTASQHQGGPEQEAADTGIEQQGRFDMKPLGADYSRDRCR